MPTHAHSSTSYGRDVIAQQVRRRIWAPEVGYGRWRGGPLSVGISWPRSRSTFDRFTLVGGYLRLSVGPNGDCKLEGRATLCNCTLGVMVGTYYANLDLG